jgi:hypothetical protein
MEDNSQNSHHPNMMLRPSQLSLAIAESFSTTVIERHCLILFLIACRGQVGQVLGIGIASRGCVLQVTSGIRLGLELLGLRFCLLISVLSGLCNLCLEVLHQPGSIRIMSNLTIQPHYWVGIETDLIILPSLMWAHAWHDAPQARAPGFPSTPGTQGAGPVGHASPTLCWG